MTTGVPLPEPLCNLPSYCQDAVRAHAAAVSAADNKALREDNTRLQNEVVARLRERVRVLEGHISKIDLATFSHVDGRDLFAQMHPRNTLDIKRRVDARETWYEGDWLTDLWATIKSARAALKESQHG